MIFNKTTRYMIRVCWHLAKNYERIVPASELTNELNIPYKYLTHLMLKLRGAGLVENFRGKNGGYRLSKAPSKIYLKDIVEIEEDLNELEKCIFLINEECKEDIQCTLKYDWGMIKKHLQNMLFTKTIGDLTSINLSFKKNQKKH